MGVRSLFSEARLQSVIFLLPLHEIQLNMNQFLAKSLLGKDNKNLMMMINVDNEGRLTTINIFLCYCYMPSTFSHPCTLSTFSDK